MDKGAMELQNHRRQGRITLTDLPDWPVNVSECYKFWRANGVDCSNCIRACPRSLPNRGWL
jgi:hypothetical protein